MADANPSRGVGAARTVALVVAALLAVAAVAFVVVSLSEREDARDALDAASADLARTRARAATAEERYVGARTAADGLTARLEAFGPQFDGLVVANDEDLGFVRAAIQAGIAGSTGAYNAAVNGRNGVITAHDAALEQLRVAANDVLSGLALFKG
jgi:hypothetical protein